MSTGKATGELSELRVVFVRVASSVARYSFRKQVSAPICYRLLLGSLTTPPSLAAAFGQIASSSYPREGHLQLVSESLRHLSHSLLALGSPARSSTPHPTLAMSFESPNHPHFKNHATRPPLPYFSKPRKLAKLKAIALQIIPLTVIFGLGALGQLLFTSFGVPLIHWGLGHTWWSVLFGGATLPVVLILGPWIQPTLQSFGLLANPRMANVVKDKVWAQLPGGEENDKGIVQSPEWALLIIGARDNSPFGVSKEFAKIGAAFTSVRLPRSLRHSAY